MSLVKKSAGADGAPEGLVGGSGGAASSVSRGNLRQQSVRQTKARRARGWDWETPAVPPSPSSSRLLLLRRDSTRLDPRALVHTR